MCRFLDTGASMSSIILIYFLWSRMWKAANQIFFEEYKNVCINKYKSSWQEIGSAEIEHLKSLLNWELLSFYTL